MGKPLPMELRQRVVDFVEEGHTHRAAAAQFRVSIKFVNDMVILKRETGSLEAKPQGNGGGHGKLAGVVGWTLRRITEKRDLTLDELVAELREGPGVEVHRVSVWRCLRGLDLTHKKDLRAIEQKRPDVAAARQVWTGRRLPFMRNMLPRLGFIDVEAGTAIDPGDRFPRRGSLKTNMAKTTGWAPNGARLVDHAPFGHWQTQTFIAALRHDRLDAPWVLDGAMNRDFFDLYVETQLAPTLHKGDVVILDNLATHRSPKAAAILKDIGAWFLFLPPYSPDLNPIEMAFAKLKALIRKAAARSCDQLWKAVGHVCDLFKEEEYYNFFKAAGYETD